MTGPARGRAALAPRHTVTVPGVTIMTRMLGHSAASGWQAGPGVDLEIYVSVGVAASMFRLPPSQAATPPACPARARRAANGILFEQIAVIHRDERKASRNCL